MVKSVYVEQAGEILDFPDSATPQQMQAYIDRKYGAAVAAPATPPAEAGPDESGVLGRAAYGFATGFTDIPGGIASLIYPSEEAVKTSAGQFSEEARKYLQETFGIDPTKDPTAAQQAAQAIGSVGSFLVPGAAVAKGASLAGLALKGAARAGTATAAAQGVALGASGRSQKIQQQLAAGMEISPEEQLAAQRLDGLIGASEALPINRFFGPLNTILSKVPVSKAGLVEKIVQSRLAKIGKAGIAEGAQEAATGIANDLVEYGVYNPDVEIGQDLLSNAGTGAFAGSFVEGIIQLAAGRRLAPARQLQKDIETEGIANLQARRMGEVSRAAEELRAAGVEGNVDVVEEEFDGLPRFVVKTPKGESVGNFTDPESAKQAIDLYQQRTGAKVAIKPSAQAVAPKAFPIKIGKKKYNSIDAIREDRDAAILQRESVAKFVTDPDLLAKKAAELKIDPDQYRSIAFADVQKRDSLIKKLSAYLPEKPEVEVAAETPAEVEEAIGATPRLALPAPTTTVEEADIAATTEAEPIGGVPVRQEGVSTVSAPVVAETAETPPVKLETALKAIPVQTGFDEAAYQAGPISGAMPRPTTASQAEITGPFVKARTPEVEQWYTDVLAGVEKRVKSIVPGEVTTRFTELIQSDPRVLVRGQVRTEKTPNGVKTILDLSTGVLRPGMTVEEAVTELVKTVDHEIVHILRMDGIWRKSEWDILSKAAAKTNVPGKKYTYLDKAQAVYAPSNALGQPQPISPVYADPDAIIEEAVAEMYKDWVINKSAPQQTRGLFNRVTEFFRRIFRTLKDTGFEKIFRAVDAGEMLSRTPTETREGGERLSAAPIPAYVEAKNRTLFRPEPKQSFFQTVSDFFLAPPTEARTLNTAYGRVDVKAGTRRAIAGRQAVVDRAAIVEFLEKTKNLKENNKFELYSADVSATAALTFNNRASHQTISFIVMGDLGVNFATPGDIQSATIQARESNDSLLNVFKVLMQQGPPDPVTGEPRDLRTVFKSYATAIRAKNKRAAGEKVPAELDDTYINTTIPFVQQDYPEVVQAYEMYQRVNKKLVTALRDSGNISDAELAALTRDMDYYGFYRELHQEELVPGVTSKTAGKFKLREYTGSDYGNLIDDPMFVMIQNAQYLISSMSRNIATQKVFNLARDMGEAKLLGATEKPDQSQGYASEVMFFKEKGVLKRFAVKDPLLVATLGADDRVDIGSTMKHIGLPASIIRESVTRDPAFMVANLLRDTVSSWITSGEDITPFIGTAKGFADALRQTSSYKTLMGHGVTGSYDLAMQDASQVAARIRDRITPANVHSLTSGAGLVSVVRMGWEKLGLYSEASDAATRIAVYEAAKRQGLSDAEASFRAIRIMDFSRRGDSQILSLLTKLIPFLNARIQGLDVLYQAGRAGIRYARGASFGDKDKNLGKQFLVRGALLAAISMAVEMMNQDDEAYENLPEYMKTGNLLIPLKFLGLEGDFLAIPKPFEAGLLFSTFPQQFYRTMTGDVGTRQNVNLFVESFGSTFGVNPIPQFLLPAIEVMTNHDFYTGLPLVSEGKARLAPELQYDSRTSTLSMMLSGIPIKYDMDTGKFTGVSPITIDTLIGGYLGPFGTLITSGVGHMMELVDVGPERMPRPMTDAPIIRRFFVDAETRSPKTVAEAYELFRIVDEANRSFSRLRQSGDAEAAMDYLEENKNILAYKKYIYKLTNQLNKIGSYERQIERNKEMTRAEKLEALEKTRDMRVKLTAQIKEINRALGR